MPRRTIATVLGVLAIACPTILFEGGPDKSVSTAQAAPAEQALVPLSREDKVRRTEHIAGLRKTAAASEQPASCSEPAGRVYNPPSSEIYGDQAFFPVIEFKCWRPDDKLRWIVQPADTVGGYRASSGDPEIVGRNAMFTEPKFTARRGNTKVNTILLSCSPAGAQAIDRLVGRDMLKLPTGCTTLYVRELTILVKGD